MTRLFLHIGSPKAGSSAIQAAIQGLSEAAMAGADLQVLPANPYGKPFPSGFVAARYMPPADLPRYLRLRQQRDPEQFQQDLQQHWRLLSEGLRRRPQRAVAGWRWPWPLAQRSPQGGGTALLSSEYLWRLPADQVRRFRQDFEALGVDDFRVIAYVRQPVSAYASFLQQWLRLSTDLERYNPLRWHYRPRQHLETWEAVFGDALVVRPFERDQLQGGSVVQDCFAQLSAWLDRPVQGEEVSGVNEALSTEELFLVQDLLRSLPPASLQDPQWPFRMARFRRLLSQSAPPLDCRPVRLQPWVRDQVWQRHQQDLDWLEQRHGVVFPAPAELSSATAAPPEQTTGFRLDQLLCPPEDSARTLALMRQQLIAVLAEGV